MKELFVWFDFNVRIEIDEELEENSQSIGRNTRSNNRLVG